MTTERERLDNAKARVLNALREAAPCGVANHALAHPDIGGMDAPRRVRELRAAGYAIDRVHIARGRWDYFYKGYAPVTQASLFEAIDADH